MGRQKQIEQVWVNDEDRKYAEMIAEHLTDLGYDLTPTAPNAPEGSISYTKLLRILLHEKMRSIVRHES